MTKKPRFNGAAPVKERKTIPSPPRRVWSSSRFNGAAPVKERKTSRTVHSRPCSPDASMGPLR